VDVSAWPGGAAAESLDRRGCGLSLEVVAAAPGRPSISGAASSMAIRYEGRGKALGSILAALLETADADATSGAGSHGSRNQ